MVIVKDNDKKKRLVIVTHSDMDLSIPDIEKVTSTIVLEGLFSFDLETDQDTLRMRLYDHGHIDMTIMLDEMIRQLRTERERLHAMDILERGRES